MRSHLTVMGALVLTMSLAGCGGVDGEKTRDGSGGGFLLPGPARAAIFSPDGTRVAYGWRGSTAFHGLYVKRLDGSSPHVLYRDHNEIIPLEWSADGMHILTLIRRPGQSDDLVLVSTDGFLQLIGGPVLADGSRDAEETTAQARRRR